ncbi:MAG: hypothetical protein DRJ15_14725 [Bacteroidetes bacterium]|nr:MAG: hypothetical protein DRJ15_14725 [Bacteroidota bacterium]
MENPPLPTKIDYRKIVDALEFYQQLGYERLEVPWIVNEQAMAPTSPADASQYETWRGMLVASAEQSFIAMMQDGNLPPGRYVTCSPCFRDEELDEHHHYWFEKVELIDNRTDPSYQEMLGAAMGFFGRYTHIRPETVSQEGKGIDILINGVEVGSYGIREYQGMRWVYGTGCAEPRLSQALALTPRGYHLADIPRGNLGYQSKIEEELREFQDALVQENPVMALTELSDLIGAIEAYLQCNHPSITLENLLTMDKTTARAFKNGRRN